MAAQWQTAVAGVSSFGFSGTNAHVVAARRRPSSASVAEYGEPRQPGSPAAVVGAYTGSPGAPGVADTSSGWSGSGCSPGGCLQHGRGGPLALRASRRVGGGFAGDAQGGCCAHCARSVLHPVWCGGCAVTGRRQRGCFRAGQSVPGMARELFDDEPVFRETVAGAPTVLDGVLARPLLDVLLRHRIG